MKEVLHMNRILVMNFHGPTVSQRLSQDAQFNIDLFHLIGNHNEFNFHQRKMSMRKSHLSRALLLKMASFLFILSSANWRPSTVRSLRTGRTITWQKPASLKSLHGGKLFTSQEYHCMRKVVYQSGIPLHEQDTSFCFKPLTFGGYWLWIHHYPNTLWINMCFPHSIQADMFTIHPRERNFPGFT